MIDKIKSVYLKTFLILSRFFAYGEYFGRLCMMFEVIDGIIVRHGDLVEQALGL